MVTSVIFPLANNQTVKAVLLKNIKSTLPVCEAIHILKCVHYRIDIFCVTHRYHFHFLSYPPYTDCAKDSYHPLRGWHGREIFYFHLDFHLLLV